MQWNPGYWVCGRGSAWFGVPPASRIPLRCIQATRLPHRYGSVSTQSIFRRDVLLYADLARPSRADMGRTCRSAVRGLCADPGGAAISHRRHRGASRPTACNLDVAGRRCRLFRTLARDQGGIRARPWRHQVRMSGATPKARLCYGNDDSGNTPCATTLISPRTATTSMTTRSHTAMSPSRPIGPIPRCIAILKRASSRATGP